MFSVMAGDTVLDVVVRKTPGPGQPVELVNWRKPKEPISLGFVLKDTSGITPNWWAYGYYPNQAILPPSKYFIGQLAPTIEKTEGFATRHFAICHMLRRCGYWEN